MFITIFGIVRTKKIWLKYMLGVPLLLFVIASVRILSLVIEYAYPNDTDMIGIMNAFYRIFTSFMYPAIGICVIVALMLGVKALVNWNNNRKGGNLNPLEPLWKHN